MSTPAIIVIVVIAVLAVTALLYLMQRRANLRKQFGPEYDQVVHETGNTYRAESLLEARARRVKKYEIRTLTREEHHRFLEAWRQLQTRFVDDPTGSVAEADRLVTDLMTTRGYPMGNFERHVEDLSVYHPHVVSHYRDAHIIAVRHERAGASTEDLRQALVHYRSLFDDLLDIHEPERKRA